MFNKSVQVVLDFEHRLPRNLDFFFPSQYSRSLSLGHCGHFLAVDVVIRMTEFCIR